MRRIIDAAAREGKTLLELPVYDGSENGEKIYNTLTVIGREIAPDEKKPDDAAAGKAGAGRAQALAGHHQLFRAAGEPNARRADARSMRSGSSSTRTASRARCGSTTAISSSAARLTSLEIKDATARASDQASSSSMAMPRMTASRPNFARKRSTACSAAALRRRSITRSAGSASAAPAERADADADQAEFGAVGLARQQFAAGGEDPRRELGRAARANARGCAGGNRRS